MVKKIENKKKKLVEMSKEEKKAVLGGSFFDWLVNAFSGNCGVGGCHNGPSDQAFHANLSAY